MCKVPGRNVFFSQSILRLGELKSCCKCRCCRSVSVILHCVDWQVVLDVLKAVTDFNPSRRVGYSLSVEKVLPPKRVRFYSTFRQNVTTFPSFLLSFFFRCCLQLNVFHLLSFTQELQISNPTVKCPLVCKISVKSYQT